MLQTRIETKKAHTGLEKNQAFTKNSSIFTNKFETNLASAIVKGLIIVSYLYSQSAIN